MNDFQYHQIFQKAQIAQGSTALLLRKHGTVAPMIPLQPSRQRSNNILMVPFLKIGHQYSSQFVHFLLNQSTVLPLVLLRCSSLLRCVDQSDGQRRAGALKGTKSDTNREVM